MATKKTNVSSSYKALLSKTDSEIQAENLDFTVELAENEFESGLLSLKKKLIGSQEEVKKQEVAVKTANKALESAKSSNPESLVQNLVNAKTAVKQAELNLETAGQAYAELKEMYSFLEEVKAELF